jgi:hypothetical protein
MSQARRGSGLDRERSWLEARSLAVGRAFSELVRTRNDGAQAPDQVARTAPTTLQDMRRRPIRELSVFGIPAFVRPDTQEEELTQIRLAAEALLVGGTGRVLPVADAPGETRAATTSPSMSARLKSPIRPRAKRQWLVLKVTR